jgi:uncharacterized protein with HEPN domain
MRDKLMRGYDIVALDKVWKTADANVPELLFAIASLPSKVTRCFTCIAREGVP